MIGLRASHRRKKKGFRKILMRTCGKSGGVFILMKEGEKKEEGSWATAVNVQGGSAIWARPRLPGCRYAQQEKSGKGEEGGGHFAAA